MKKLIFKFLSVLFSFVVLMSWCCVLVSAEDGDLNSPLVTHWSEMPLKVKSNFFENDVLKYDGFFVFRFNTNLYQIFNFKLVDDYYFEINTSGTKLRHSSGSSSSIYTSYATYNSSTCEYTYYDSGTYGSIGSFCLKNFTLNGTDMAVDTAKKNIVYSDIQVKYAGLTIFDPATDNKSFTVPGLFDNSGSSGGSDTGNTSGTLLYGSYVQKNEETLKAFCQWLIDTGKYTDLASYGFKVSSNNLYNVVDCWWDNKFSPALFWELFKTNGLNSISSASSVICWFSARWSEYVSINNAVVEIPYSDSDNVNMHHRATDVTEDVTETVTDENGNTSTVVVQQKDTELLLVLREILRQVINLPSNVAKSTYSFFYALVSNIADNVYSLCLSISELPYSIANYVYNNFVNSMNLILEKIDNVVAAINNIDFSSNNSNITNNNINVDVNFNNDIDYNVTFGDIELTLNNKFSFYKQLTEIKNIFENADFSDETAPEFETSSVTLADGVVIPSYSLDFSLFDKYRTMIHSIIIAVSYLSFFINLLHRLPEVIGGI